MTLLSLQRAWIGSGANLTVAASFDRPRRKHDRHIWASNYDCPTTDLLELQDLTAASVARDVSSALEKARQTR